MTLLFIYNSNSGSLNALLDAGHKLFSPSTYKCRLCALTHDVFSENETWKTFRTETHYPMEFYHKDEFEVKFPGVNMMYPTILKLENQQLTTVINPDILNEIIEVDGLIKKLKANI